MKPDERTLYVLTRLRAPDFKPYLEWLAASRSEVIETLVKAKDPEYKARLSGKAELYKEMMDAVETSPDVLKKLTGTSGP